MTRARPVQNAFSSGELDPRLHARNDFQRFKTGQAVCRGFMPLRQGAFTRAPGTIWRGNPRNSAPSVRIPFVFADDDAVELEFTDGIMRVWRYGEPVMDGASPYELATPYVEADLPNLDFAQDGDVIFIVDGRQPMQQLSRLALDIWTIAAAELEAGPFRGSNTDENRTIQVAVLSEGVPVWEAGEALTIGEQRKYGRNVYTYGGLADPAGGAFADGACGPRAPTHAAGVQDYTFNNGVNDVTVRWTFDSATASLGRVRLDGIGDVFDAQQVGSLMLIEPADFSNVPVWVGNSAARNGQLVVYDSQIYRHVAGSDSGVNAPVHASGTVMTDGDTGATYQHISDLQGIVRITDFTGANTVEGDILRHIPQPCIDDPTWRWSEAAWSEKYGFPAAIEVEEQRLFAAASSSSPRTLWASAIGDFQGFLPGGDADASFAYTLESGGQKNRIVWLARGRRGLFIGSLGEVHRAYSSSDQDAIGPTTFAAEIVSTEGAAAARPIAPFGDPIVIARSGRKLGEIRFSFQDEGSRPVDLSLPSQHLGASPFQAIAWQAGPLQQAWLRRADGLLVVMVYDPDQEVLGWAPVPTAGGFVEDICVSPNADGSGDIVTLTIRRTINGATVRTFEEISDNETLAQAGAGLVAFNHLFCAASWQGAATDTLSVPHLAGETVTAWTDAGNFDALPVAGDGAISLPAQVTQAFVGLFDDTHLAESLPIQPVARDGDGRGRQHRLHATAGIVLHQTAGGQVSAVEREFGKAERTTGWKDLVSSSVANPPAELQSGTATLEVPSGHARDLRYRIRPQGGAPLTVLAVVPDIEERGA